MRSRAAAHGEAPPNGSLPKEDVGIDEDGDRDFHAGRRGPYPQLAAQQDNRVAAIVAAGGGDQPEPESRTTRLDSDSDSDTHQGVSEYGRPASSRDLHEITALVHRYLRAGVTHNGAAGCALLVPRLAASLPSSYGRNPLLYGSTCAAILSKLFARRSQELAFDVRELNRVIVRSSGQEAIAFLSFARSSRGRQFSVQRVGKKWKLNGLLDGTLPFDGESLNQKDQRLDE